jgi:hypothetical protein
MSERIEYFKKRSPLFCNSSIEFFNNVINQLKNTFKEDNYEGIIILLCNLLRYDLMNHFEIARITTYYRDFERNKSYSDIYEDFESFCDEAVTKFARLKQSCSSDIEYSKYRSLTCQYASVRDFRWSIEFFEDDFKKGNKYEAAIKLLCTLLNEDILDNTEILKITEYFRFTKIQQMRNSNFAFYCDLARTKFVKLKMESMQSL